MTDKKAIIKQVLAGDPKGVEALTSLLNSGSDYDFETVVRDCLCREILPNESFWAVLAAGLAGKNLTADAKRAIVNYLRGFLPGDFSLKPGTESEYRHVLQCFPLIIDMLDEAESSSDPNGYRATILLFIMNRGSNPLYAVAFEPKLAKFVEHVKIGQALEDRDPDGFFGDLISCMSNFASCEEVLPTLRTLGLDSILAKSLKEDTGIIRVICA
jgi:hypothetical protein